MREGELAQAFDKIFEKSSTRNWIIGRLGVFDGTIEEIDVEGRPGYVVVSTGSNGDQGVTIAKDAVGAARIVFQEVRMRRELGELVIREASAYAGGSGGGGGGALDDLSDVTLFTLTNGEVLTYSTSLGKWTNLPSGGAGSTYSAGNGLALTGSVFSVKPKPNEGIDADSTGTFVKRNSTGAIGSDNAGLFVVPKTTGGLATDASGIFVFPKSAGGLATDAGGVYVVPKAAGGLATDSGGVYIVPKTNGGLASDAGGVYVVTDPARSITNSAAGIGVVPRPDYGLFNNAAGLGILKPGNSGLVLDSSGLYVGAPSSGSVSSTNSVTATTHAHAIVTSSNVGTVPAQAILASTGGGSPGQLTLAQLTIVGNLLFTGGNRSITASNNLTIAPTTDLILDPGGNVELPIAQQVITSTYNDFVSNITGYRNWDTGGNLRQISISKIKADELFVRFFTADEVRVNRGEEFWGRSYGIVESEFTLPAIGVNSDVWFEEAPDLGSAKLFLPDNWLLARQIDITTSLVTMAIWFRVIDAGANDYITRQDAVEGSAGVSGTPPRQQWRIQRRSGGVTGEIIRKGNCIVDFGKPYDDAVYPDTTPVQGQGIVHLSALAQDGGPFIQIQTFDHITSDVPQFKNRVRMGHLSGFAGMPNDVWGFGAGNDGSLTPTSGFSGLIARHDTGMSLYNTSVLLYSGSTLEASLSKDYGLRLLQDTGPLVNDRRSISWHSTLSSVMPPIAWVSSYDQPNEKRMDIIARALGASLSARTVIGASQDTPFASPFVEVSSGLQETSEAGGLIRLYAQNTYVWGKLKVGQTATPIAVSPLHVYENTANISTNAGVTIEQDGTGDAMLQFLLTGGQRFVMGIDNSNGDIFGITSTASLGGSGLLVSPAGEVSVYAAPSLNAMLSLRDGDMANPFTTGFTPGLDADEIGRMASASNTDGGLAIQAFSEATAVAALYLQGHMGSTAPTVPAVRIDGYKHNGSGGRVALASGEMVLQVTNAGTAIATFVAGARVGIGTPAPGIDVVGTTDYLPGSLLHISSATSAGMVVSGDVNAEIHLIHGAAAANQRWFRIAKTGTYTTFQHIADIGSTVGPRLSIGSATAEGIAVGGLPESGTAFLIESDGSKKGLVLEEATTGSHNYQILGRRAQGTLAAPAAVASGVGLLSIGALGYTTGGWANAGSAEIQFRSTEDYNTGVGGKGGAEIMFYTRTNGAASYTEKFRIQHDGMLYMPFVYSNFVTVVPNMVIQASGLPIRTTHANSSARYKRDILPLPQDQYDEFIAALAPVRYRLNPELDREARVRIGLVAEDVLAAGGGDFIQYDEWGRPDALMYDRLLVPIILVVQGLKRNQEADRREMARLRERIEALESKDRRLM